MTCAGIDMGYMGILNEWMSRDVEGCLFLYPPKNLYVNWVRRVGGWKKEKLWKIPC